MRYVSTEGDAPDVSLEEAVFAGPAPDGGLYVPETLPEVTAPSGGGDLVENSLPAARALFGEDIPDDVLEEIVRSSLDFEVPLVQIEEGLFCLELFHGPTLAFKDVGARFMARLIAHFLSRRGREATVLVATSGDTGSAVAQAFLGLSAVRVVVLFPKGKVSSLQQKLFTTLGENVTAIAIEGSFDDCQRIAKEAFADRNLMARRPLVSANSINVARLLPQTFYYFHAAAQVPPTRRERPIFSTPSGNFGNLTAGLIAMRMGLAVERFVAATNVNDVVPEYLESGVFRPRPSIRTLTNAMDVGNPSNFARIHWLYGGNVEAMRRDIVGSAHTDEETRAAIRNVHERTGYVLDPHGAVGYLGAKANGATVFLATAHPAKFRETVEKTLGRSVALPRALAECDLREEHILDLPADYSALRDTLVS